MTACLERRFGSSAAGAWNATARIWQDGSAFDLQTSEGKSRGRDRPSSGGRSRPRDHYNETIGRRVTTSKGGETTGAEPSPMLSLRGGTRGGSDRTRATRLLAMRQLPAALATRARRRTATWYTTDLRRPPHLLLVHSQRLRQFGCRSPAQREPYDSAATSARSIDFMAFSRKRPMSFS